MMTTLPVKMITILVMSREILSKGLKPPQKNSRQVQVSFGSSMGGWAVESTVWMEVYNTCIHEQQHLCLQNPFVATTKSFTRQRHTPVVIFLTSIFQWESLTPRYSLSVPPSVTKMPLHKYTHHRLSGGGVQYAVCILCTHAAYMHAACMHDF